MTTLRNKSKRSSTVRRSLKASPAVDNDDSEERSTSGDGMCLLCDESCEDMKVHLRVAHQSEVAVAAIFPSDDEKSRWIRSFILDGNGFSKTAARSVQFEETPSSSPSDETAGSSGIITNAIKVEEDVDHLEKNGVDDMEEITEEAAGSPATESSGRLTCQMCGEQLRAQEARRHIFKEHLDVEDLFRCSACNFKSSCSQQVVRSHAQRTHGDKNAVVSRLPEYKERISTLELRCFPSKGRRTENEWVTCAICEQVMRMFERREHVLREHLAVIDMFSCRHCDYKNSYDRHYTISHSKKSHADAEIVSREAEYSEEIQKLQNRCFPRSNTSITHFKSIRRKSAAEKVKTAAVGRNQCNVCGKAVHGDFATHIRKKHLPPLYSSPDCGYSSYESDIVLAHMKRYHATTSADNLTNLSAEYANEFLKMYKICFEETSAHDFASPLVSGLEDIPAGGCQLCYRPVEPSQQRAHIFEQHLAVDDLFKCGVCDFGSDHDQAAVREHTLAVHGDASAFVSRVIDQQDKIAAFEVACFSDKKQAETRQCDAAFNIKNVCLVAERSCRQCEGEKIKRADMQNHVYKHHMPPRFLCPYCDEGRYRKDALNFHVKTHHAGLPARELIDKTDEYRSEFIAAFKDCFGD